MARPLRIEYEGALYHVTARGNERGKIFFTKSDYQKFKEYLADVQEKYGVILHCYVLMTNHYHLLIETPEKNLSKIMHFLNSCYTTYINIKRKRNGHLLQGRYKSIVIDKSSYLQELSRYIHLNPVRAKMVDRPEEYPYSSYNAYISDIDELVTSTAVLSMFHQDIAIAREKYRVFIENSPIGEIENPFKNVYGGMILGNPAFIKSTLQRIDGNNLDNQEICHRKALQALHNVDDIITIICKRRGLLREELFSKDRNNLRKICIYLMKKYAAETNRQIGALFGGMSHLAVAKAYQRIIFDFKTDTSLRKEIEWYENELSHVKG